MVRSILVGLDGSASGRAAVELGIRWAKQFDALLVGLGIVDESAIRERESMLVGVGRYKAQRDARHLIDTRRRVGISLDWFVRRCIREGVKHRAVQEVGTPDTQIVQKSRLYNLIMLGQEPRFRFDLPYWPDETLTEVLRQVSRPVVVVPDSPQEGSDILVAYDGSPQADRALQAFQALGLAGEDRVHVLSARSDRADAERLAGEAVDFLDLHGIKATPLPISSRMSADRIIIAQVQEVQPRLLVMGAYGRSIWREFVFGSTTARLLETSPLPLFLCR